MPKDHIERIAGIHLNWWDNLQEGVVATSGIKKSYSLDTAHSPFLPTRIGYQNLIEVME